MNNIPNIVNQAISLANQNRDKEAIVLLKECEDTLPSDSWIKLNLANSYIKTEQDSLAVDCLRELADGEQDNAELLTQASRLANTISRFDISLMLSKKAQAIAPNNVDVLAQLLMNKIEARDSSGQESICKAMKKLAPTSSWPDLQLGHYYSSKGSFVEAEKGFLAAIEKESSLSYAFAGLVKCQKYQEMPIELCKKLDKALQMNEEVYAKTRLYLAKAKIFNDLGVYNEAWGYAEKGNSLRERVAPFSQAEYSAYIEKIQKGYSQNAIKQNISSSKKEHVLIVGMPRSGTTLIEQILSSDEDYYAGGETPAIDYAIYQEIGQKNYLDELPISVTSLNNMANNYESFFKRFANYKGRKIIDKVPSNYLYIGLYLSIFPQAKVINFKRNKFDVSTSIFFENFGMIFNYTNNIKDILFVYDKYKELMEFWQRLFSSNILTIDYDDFVSNNEQSRQRVCDFIGINSEQLTSHICSENRVETPSIWQVRQGIYQSSIERWRRYDAMVTLVETNQ